MSQRCLPIVSLISVTVKYVLVKKRSEVGLLNFGALTHWGRATHICVGNITSISSDNGLSPNRRQAIIWTNARILFIRPLGISFNEMLIEILTFSFMKMHFKVSSAKWRPFCLGLNVLISPVVIFTNLQRYILGPTKFYLYLTLTRSHMNVIFNGLSVF